MCYAGQCYRVTLQDFHPQVEVETVKLSLHHKGMYIKQKLHFYPGSLHITWLFLKDYFPQK